MRLFFAVDLPQKVTQGLGRLSERYGHLAMRWTKPENLHLTLLFLGWRETDELPSFVAAAEKVATNHKPFVLTLENLIFGPPDRPPRMIWLSGPTPPEFTNLSRSLSETTSVPLDHPPTVHLTLARSRETIRAPQGQTLETLSLPPIEVKEFQLMESKLQQGGAEYTVLKSFSLSGNA